MMGPPLRKLSMKKLPVRAGPAGGPAGDALGAAEADGSGVRLPLNVAFTLESGAGAPGAPGTPGAPGLAGGGGFTAVPGAAAVPGTGLTNAAGLPGAPGNVAAGTGAVGGGGSGAAGRFCENAHKAIRLKQRVSIVFISAAMIQLRAPLPGPILIPKGFVVSPAKILAFI